MREKTHAHRNYQDDISQDIKQKRLEEMIDVFHKNQEEITKKEIGR